MDKAIVKNVLCFVVGAAVGSAVTFFATKKVIQSKADAEIEDMRHYVDERLRPFRTADKMNEKAAEMEDEAMRAEFDIQVPDVDAASYINYTELARKYKSESNTSDELKGPRIISEDEYIDPIPYYDKISLEYSRSSGKLCDVSDDSELDYDAIGSENIDELIRSDEEIMFIRNDRISTDYEITLVD